MATRLVAMMVPPPVTFSTMNVWPNFFDRKLATTRAVWSVGPQLAETLIDFGARRAQVKNARAVYDQRVAQYRQTVLAAFQGVEDQIAALRVLEQEASLRNTAETSARQAETLTLNQYNAGQVDFTTVVTAENTALTAETNSLNVRVSTTMPAPEGRVSAGWRERRMDSGWGWATRSQRAWPRGGWWDIRTTRALVSTPGNGVALGANVITASRRNRSVRRSHKRREETPSQISAGRRKANRPPGLSISRQARRK